MNPTEALIQQTAQAMLANGLAAAGYTYINLDDGIMAPSRAANGSVYFNPPQFPSGAPALAAYLHGLGFKFGLYTDRGTQTCGGRPGSQGYEQLDAQTYADFGVDYVKEDSCNAPQDHQTAFAQYSLMRDALNASGLAAGRPIFFSLCGWESWYAPVGTALGNSYRIGPDDTNWDGLLVDVDDMAALWPYTGPGGRNDPCLLLGRDASGNVAVTDAQGRAQFSMWAVLAAPLLLSQDVRNLTAFQLATYLNPEVIAVSQDQLGRAGQRLAGNAVSLKRSHPGAPGATHTWRSPRGWTGPVADSNIPITLQPCGAATADGSATPSAQQWVWNTTAPGFVTNVASGMCMNSDDCGPGLIVFDCVTTGGTCCGSDCYDNEVFALESDGTLRSPLFPGQCATSYGGNGQLAFAPCVPGLASQAWTYSTSAQTIADAAGNCVTAGGGNNTRAAVWGRPLSDGSWALVFLNADIMPANIVCDAACLAATGWDSNQVMAVRDLWARADAGFANVSTGLTAEGVPADGGVVMLRVTPWFNATLAPSAARD
jgi:hypothetical protein